MTKFDYGGTEELVRREVMGGLTSAQTDSRSRGHSHDNHERTNSPAILQTDIQESLDQTYRWTASILTDSRVDGWIEKLS